MVWLLGCNLLQFHQSPWTSPTFKERNLPQWWESALQRQPRVQRGVFSGGVKVSKSKSSASGRECEQEYECHLFSFFFCNTWGIWRTFAGNYLKLDVVPSCQEMMATQSSLRLRPTLDLDPWDLVFLLITKFKFKRPQCRKSKCKWSMQTKRGFWIHVECFCFLKVSRLDSQKHSLNKPVSFILKPCLLLLAKPYLPHKELEKLIHAFITPHWTIVTLFTWASS